MSAAALAALGLLLVRPGMLVIATPVLGSGVPAPIRVGLTVLLALVIAPSVALPPVLTTSALVLVVARELAIGLALALAVRVLVAAAEFAGHFAGYQVGLSMGALIDPQTGVRSGLLAGLYAYAVTLICFASNLHHVLLRALVDSYRLLPVGLGGVDDSLPVSIARLLGLVFVLGVRIAAPVVAVLLLVEVALGLLARLAPALNVMIAGAPVRLVVGLLVVAATVVALPPVIRRIFPAALDLATGAAGAFR